MYTLRGYEREASLPPNARVQIDLFIAYRRALLFTVMYDRLKTKPDALAAWKRMTLEQPSILACAPIER